MKTPFKLKSGNTTPFKQMGSSPLKGKWYTVDKGSTSSDFGRTWKKKGSLTNKQKIVKELRARVPHKYHHSISNISSKGKELIKKYKGASKGLGGKVLGTLGFFLGSTGEATATQPGTGTHGGTKTPKLRDIDK